MVRPLGNACSARLACLDAAHDSRDGSGETASHFQNRRSKAISNTAVVMRNSTGMIKWVFPLLPFHRHSTGRVDESTTRSKIKRARLERYHGQEVRFPETVQPVFLQENGEIEYGEAWCDMGLGTGDEG